MKPTILLFFLFATIALGATDEPLIDPIDDSFYSLRHLISFGGPIQIFLQTANLGVFLYVLMRSVLAWRRYWKLPPPSVLISLSLIPIFLSTTVAIVYLSQFLTNRQYHALLDSGSINEGLMDGVGSALMLIDCVRISLYSGLLCTSLILITFCATRKLNCA